MNMEGSFRVKFLDSFFSSFLKKGKKHVIVVFETWSIWAAQLVQWLSAEYYVI